MTTTQLRALVEKRDANRKRYDTLPPLAWGAIDSEDARLTKQIDAALLPYLTSQAEREKSDAERKLGELKAALRWIPIEQRPDIGDLQFKHFLICNPYCMMFDIFTNGKFTREGSILITHYREVPENPAAVLEPGEGE